MGETELKTGVHVATLFQIFRSLCSSFKKHEMQTVCSRVHTILKGIRVKWETFCFELS